MKALVRDNPQIYHNGRASANPALTPGTAQDDKLIPFDEDSERNLLGGILIDNGLLPDVITKGVKPDTFYIGRYSRIYDAMLQLHEAGQSVAPVTLANKLKAGETENIDWLIELQQIESDTLSVYAALTCAEIIKEKADRRNSIDFIGQALALLDEASRQVYDEAIPPELTPATLAAEIQARAGEAIFQDSIDGWQLCTLADAYQPRPPLVYSIEGLFSLPSLNILYGPPGTLKSMILADALICVAAGLPWLEALPGNTVKPFQTVSSPVLWVDFDNGQRRTHERFEALARARNLPATLPTLFYASMPQPWLSADDSSSIDALARLVKRNGTKVIALDNLGLISGTVDENSAAMIPVMGNLRRLAEETGTAVIILHHQRKGTGFKGREGDKLRGHSSIEASLDLALLVERDEVSDQVEVKSTKTRDVDVSPFAALWTYEHKPGTRELATARFFGVTSEKSGNLEGLQAAILAAVKASPGLSQNKLKDAVKVIVPDTANNRIRSEILAMADKGQLKAVTSGNGTASAYYPNFDYVDF